MSAETNVKDFAVGDTVEINLRAKVLALSCVSPSHLVVQPEGSIATMRFEPKFLTLVERPVKVGDEVNGKQALKLPIGSVVLYEPGGGASLKVNETQWVSTSDSKTTEPYAPTWLHTTFFTVLHIGGPDKRLTGMRTYEA